MITYERKQLVKMGNPRVMREEAEVLVEKGWEVESRDSNCVNLRRPKATKNKTTRSKSKADQKVDN